MSTATNSVETSRLTLRAFRETDIEPLYRIQSNAQAMRYTYYASSLAAAAQRLHAYAAQQEQLGFAPWTVILRSEGCVIGWGGLNIDPFDPGWGIEVAYFFHPAYWGRGFATELVQASVDYGFLQHNLTEINAYAHPDNGASARVLEKCGFQFQCFEPKLDRNRFLIYSGN
jgi:ribosomal-protein-alanine N-acetyltransferase